MISSCNSYDHTIQYRVFMHGLNYALRGIPTDDLDKHWYDVNELPVTTDPDNYSTLVDQRTVATIEHVS